jgi:hypothetical protein
MAEPLKLECSVEFEDEWRQLECHWDYKRFFTIKCKIFHGACYDASGNKVLDGETIGLKNGLPAVNLYYQLKNDSSFTTALETIYATPKAKRELYSPGCYRAVTLYECRVPFEKFNLANLCAANGYVKAKAIVKSTVGTTYEVSYELNKDASKLPYYLELAPSLSGSILVKKETSTRTLCSWPKAVASATQSPVHGYCVELRYQLGGKGLFKAVEGLTAVKEGSTYWLRKSAAVATASIEALEGEPPIESYEVDGSNLEVYLPGSDITAVYFNPTELGISKDDQIKVAIYPYTVYGSHVEDETNHESILSGTLLTGAGLQSEVENKSVGLVRVKVGTNDWREGQVWIKAADGWKEACGVYTKTSTGWKESV